MKFWNDKLKEKILSQGKAKKNAKIVGGILVVILGGLGITVSEEGIGNVVIAVMELF